MPRIKHGRPTPAFVIAVIALFVSLGGTGYAAKQITDAGAPKKPAAKSLTKPQVNKLIAAYVTAHRAELKGAQGAAGKNGDAGAKGDKGDRGEKGEKGDIGPQGPGAISLVHTGSTAEPGNSTVATVGPWTVTLTCSTSAPNSTLKIKGPGELSSSSGLSGVAPTVADAATESGVSFEVNNGQHRAVTGFLTSGSTTYQVSFQMWAEAPLFEACPVVGDAIPVPATN